MSQYLHNEEVNRSKLSASGIVKFVIDALGPVRSVVDVGGGTGAWCKEFKSLGVKTVRCIDHPSALLSTLEIELSEFIEANLSAEDVQPFEADLAVCVEVAEHLPNSRSDWLVDYLTRCSSTVIFSAAIPGQPGRNHINCQWPDFWSKRFADRGFEKFDIIRPKIINTPEIAYWYRQNLFVYSDRNIPLKDKSPFVPDEFLVVHESIIRNLQNPTLKELFKQGVPSVRRFIEHRFATLKNYFSG